MRLASLLRPLGRLVVLAAATLLATAPARAQLSGSLVLNGTTAVAEIAHKPVLNVGSFTVEAWVKPSAAPSGLVSIVSKGPSTVAGRGEYELLLGTDLKPVARIRTANGVTTSFSGTVTVPVGAWTHVAMVYEGSILRLYVNAQAAGATASAGAPEAGANLLRIGGAATGGAGRFAGQIDEVRLWTKGRSQAEIDGARAVQASGTEAGLVGAWSFNATDDLGAGAPGRNDARDASPNALHADLVGGAVIGTSTAPVRGMTASVDAFEDRVEVRWTTPTPASATVRVRRNQQLLTTLPATATAFDDATGTAGQRYTYCVAVVSGGVETAYGCEDGRRALKVPGDVSASDGTFTDRVRVSWTDRSAVETGYRVYRDGALLTPTALAAGSYRYDDLTASANGTPHAYCVEPVQGDGAGGQACDTGYRGSVLPVATVAASDGTWPGFTRVAWTLPAGPPATAFIVLRGGVRTDTLAGTVTEARDYGGAAGTVYGYCVVRVESTTESVPVCDAGGHGTLSPAANVRAGDDAADDRIDVTWRDAVTGETGYRVTRRTGAALAFGGSGTVRVPSNPALALTGTPFTIETWARIDTRTDGDVLIGRGAAYQMGVQADGRLRLTLGGATHLSTVSVPPDWHHLAATYDGGAVRLYIDGVPAGTATGPQTVPAAPTDAVVLGGGNGLRGALDETRVWARALTASQLQAGMFAAATGREADLLARWSFDDGVGTRVLDGAGGHHGTFAGTGLTWIAPEAPVATPGESLALALGSGAATAASSPFTGGDFTLALWARPVLPEGEAVLVGGDGPRLSVTSTGGVRYTLPVPGGADATGLVRGVFPDGGTAWVHLAWVKRGAAMLVYRNGVRIDSLGAPATYAPGTTLTLGGSGAGALGGTLGTVEAWTRARTATELRTGLFTERAGTEAGLAALWTFERATGGAFTGPTLTGRAVANGSAGGRALTLAPGAALVAGRPALAAVLPADAAAYTDRAAAAGVRARYCVSAVTAGGVETPPACDDGRRATAVVLAALTATEGTHETRTALTWPAPGSRTTYVAVYRDSTTLIATLPATRTSYDDVRGIPGRHHVYCVALGAPEGTESAPACATGWREIKAPATVAAADGTAEHEIALTWADRSEAEAGYRVLRAPATPRALRLDGTLDYASVASVPALSPGTPFTIEAWVNPTHRASGSLTSPILSKATSTATEYALGLLPGGELELSIGSSKDKANAAVPLNAWTHVAVVFNGTTAAFYINGQPSATRTISGAAPAATTGEVRIGSREGASTSFFRGSIDEVRLWSVARTPAEIAGSYAALVPADAPGLTAAWSFEESADARLSGDGAGRGALALLSGAAARVPYTGPALAPALIRTTAPSVGAYTDRTATPGVPYAYRVVAFDSLGTSEPGTDGGYRTLKAPLRASASDGTAETSVEVTWEDKSSAETGFRVLRRTDALALWTRAGSPARNESRMTDATAAPATRYTYAVAAVDAWGASEDALDAGSTVVLAPASVIASTDYTDRVSLTWADRSAIETGYRVYRGGTLLTSTALAANMTTYLDDTAPVGVASAYCVAAVAAAGESDRTCADGRRAGPPVVAVTAETLQTLLTAADPKANAAFGRAVAVDGDYAVVGAPFFNPNGSGTNDNTGAAYVFKRQANGQWTQQQRLMASDASGYDYFGLSVAIRGDYIVVGGANISSFDAQQAAYVFKRSDTSWQETQRFTADANVQRYYGSSVALSETHLFVGAPSESQNGTASGVVYAYRLEGGAFTYAQKLLPTTRRANQRFGRSLSAEGGRVVVGGPGDPAGSIGGYAFVFEKSGTTFAQTAEIVRSTTVSGFGWSVALDGDALAVGNPSNGTTGIAYVYRRGADGTWAQESFNASGATVEAFVRPDAYDGGAAARFGSDISLRDGRLLVGAEGSDTGPSRTGTGHLFERQSDGLWRPLRRLVGADASANAQYGRAVGLGPEALFMGGPGADNSGTGGAVATADLSAAPGAVAASDGSYEGRVQVRWADRSAREENFIVYRDGQKIGETGPDTRSFDDFDAPPGQASEYCVASYRQSAGESRRVCDRGWRPANGVVSGRIASAAGAAVRDARVCLSPSPARALLFDGVAGRVATGRTTADFGFTGASFTVEAWVRPTATRSDLAIVGSADASVAGVNGGMLHLDLRNGRPYFGFGGIDTQASATLPLGTWTHLAFAYDAAAQTQRIYINGVLNVTTTAKTPLVGVAPVFIGWSAAFGNSYFQGGMDEVRIWKSVRTQAEIVASMGVALTPTRGATADETPDPLAALVALYAMDGGRGRGLLDGTAGGRHGTFEGNVGWTDQTAPLDGCGTSDADGNYRLAGLRYGASQAFEARPALGTRTFQPGARTVTLSSDAPVANGVDFTDASTFTVSGTVTLAGTTCPAPGVSIDVDGSAAAQTEADGSFKTALQPRATAYALAARLAGRGFTPGRRDLTISGDIGGVAFADTTTRTVRLRVGGSCGIGLGAATVEIVAENACYAQTATTTADGVLTLRLPAQAYTARVRGVPSAPAGLRADAERYFQDLGAVAFNLTERDTTLALLYHAPLRIVLEGAPANACAAIPVPIAEQNQPLPLLYRVFEDYGSAGQCAADSARVTFTDEVADATGLAIVGTARQGVLRYRSIGGLPDITSGRIVDGVDRSHQKSITAVAQVGLRRAETTDWFVVTGKRPRTGSQFVTEVSTEVPLLVLHDPPGDGSSAFVEKGWTFCKSLSGAGYDVLDVDFSGGFYASTEVTAGLVLSAKTASVDAHVGAYTRTSLERGSDHTYQICTTPTERISTSSSEWFIGPDADVFLGAGLNLVFATTDVLDIDTNTCRFDASETVTFAPKKIETSTVYTRAHIRDVLIPQLKDLAANPSATGPGVDFAASARRWGRQLVFADSIGRKATAPFDTVRTGTPRTNVSFAAGATYEYSREVARDTTRGWMQDYTVTAGFTGDVAFTFGGLGAYFNLEIGGGRHSITRNDSTATTRRLTGYTLSDDDGGDAYSVDVRLDPYSQTPVFDVISGRSSCPFEPWLGAPLVVADGAAPSDRAPRTTPRYEPAIRVIGSPVKSGIPYNEPALFGVTLQNLSPTKETLAYVLRALPESNPGGALLQANGASLFTGQRYVLPYAGSQDVLVRVDRGPARYTYDSLAVVLTPSCEDDIQARDWGVARSATAYLSAHFAGGCSPVSLRNENWAVTRASQGHFEPFFDGFSLVGNDAGQRLKRLGLQYRLKGADVWETAALSPATSRDGLIALRPTIPLAEITAHIDAWTVPTGLPDGEYEMRALAQCERPDPANPAVFLDAAVTYSDARAGRIDRKRPDVLGTPQPASGILAFGGDIALTFDEPVRCERIRTDSLPGLAPNLVLRDDRGAVIPSTAVCDGRTVVLRPADAAALGAAEGRRLTATLRAFVDGSGAALVSGGTVLGPTDVAGNPFAADVAWSFLVRRSAFAWAATRADVPVRLGETAAVTVPLGNGRPEAVDFTIEGVPAWLTPSVSSGRLTPGATLPVAFAIADSVAGGTRLARVVARAGATTDTLTLRADIAAEVAWAVTAADFARTMSATFQVALDGPPVRHTGVQLAAFVGGQVRGVAPVTPVDTDSDGTMDGNRALLTIYGNAEGEAVTFKVWDSAARRLYATTNRTLTFEGDAVHGTPAQPLLLRAPRLVDASAIALNAGWTWVSFNRSPANSAVFTPTGVFASLGARTGDVVKSQTAFAIYDPTTGWAGTLTAFDATRAYLVRMGRSDDLVLGGTLVDPAATPIALGAGWNWLGYLPQAPLPLADALATLAATTGDVIKSQTAFAQYVSGAGWVGSLATLDPGRGYLVRLAAPGTLTYPAVPPAPAALASLATSGDATVDAVGAAGDAGAATRPAWSVDAAAFEHSMSVVAEAHLTAGPAPVGALVGAFDAAGAVRGVAPVQAVAGRALAFLTAYGAPGETLMFRVWDPAADSVHAATTTLAFAPNGIAGSVAAPFAVRIASATALAREPLPLALTLEPNRPNPFAASTSIRFGLPEAGHVRLVVYDLMGREVARLADRNLEPGWHTVTLDGGMLPSGVYVYRLVAGREMRTARMVLAR